MPVIPGSKRGVSDLTCRISRLENLFKMVTIPPTQWLTGASTGPKTNTNSKGGTDSPTMAIKTCEDYDELLKAWKKSMQWSEGLDSALSVMLASSMSTMFVGEQLWIKVIGPPSSGKTTLMEGLATATEWYLSRDTIRGFHTGMREKNEDEKPLADMCDGMTLGIKDGDTLLKAPNLKQILSEGRALYDRVSRTNYRNFVNREYLGHRMTWHLAGTKSLREIDDSELGARFLDVVVMDRIEDSFEDLVGLSAAAQEARNMLMISDGKPESQHPKELANAMALSGGYLDFLRKNALELAKSVRISNSQLARCSHLGKFVAFMRARPAREGESDREFSARLSKQFTRLTMSLAGTFGESSVTDRVMAHVHKCAMDTARGLTKDLLLVMHDKSKGMEVQGIAAKFHMSTDEVRKYFRFLRSIGVVECNANRKRWRIHPRIIKIWKEVRNP